MDDGVGVIKIKQDWMSGKKEMLVMGSEKGGVVRQWKIDVLLVQRQRVMM